MSSFDPRTLLQAIEDLTLEFNQWSIEAREIISASQQTQLKQSEAMQRGHHHAHIVHNDALNDDEQATRALDESNNLVNRANESRHNAQATLAQANHIAAEAQSTLRKWQAELQKALAWLERAKARLARAIEALKAAIEQLKVAERALDRAEWALRSCRNNKERKTCWSEEADVSNARSDVAHAQAIVEAAQAEVKAAHEEVQQAEARVACCKTAVGFSEQAVTLATEANADSDLALNSAERELESAQAAHRFANQANTQAKAELEEAELMLAETQLAQREVDEAQLEASASEKAEQQTQRYRLGFQIDAEQKMEALRLFNMPSLENKLNTHVAFNPHQQVPSPKLQKHQSDQNIPREVSNLQSQVGKRIHRFPTQDVRLDQINLSDSYVKNEEDYRKYSYKSTLEFVKKLPKVQEMLNNGATEEVFYQLDQKEGLSRGEGYEAVYRAFYGQDAIALDKRGDLFYVTDGYHRLLIAKTLGWEHIPARIINQ